MDNKENTSVQDVEQNKAETKKSGSGFHQTVYDMASTVMVSFVLITLVFVFCFRLVGVVGQSMENTLHEKDWLIITQRADYEYGDIVIIVQPNMFDEPLVKRVIATGGQTVNIDYQTSTVYVDGQALNEPYTKEDYILPKIDDIQFPYTVPDGCLFCMGDNRNGSTDCRSVNIGPIDERYILGKAQVRIFPFNSFNIYDYE